jgi:hypothetical protein
MQVCEQILQILLGELLAVRRHFLAPHPNDIADAIVVRRQSAQRKEFVLEDSLQTRPFLASRRVGFVAAAAFVVINLSTRRLLEIETEFRIRLAALYVAACNHCDRKQSGHRRTEHSKPTDSWMVLSLPHRSSQPS